VLGAGNGLGTAIAYFKDNDESIDDTAFTISALVAVTLAVLFWSFSEPLSEFWGASEAQGLIRIVSIFFPFSILAGIGNAILARDMNFRDITVVNIIATLLSTLTAIIMAYSGFGTESLIAQYVVFNTCRCAGFFAFARYWPRLDFNGARWKTILPFAYNLTTSEVMMWASSELPFVLAARSLGIEAGGVYRLYQRFCALPREIIGENLRRAAFIGMARKSPDIARSGFLWGSKLLSYTLVAVFLWMAVVAEPLTHVVLGPNFASYWQLTAVLSLGLATQTAGSMVMPYLNSQGKTGRVLLASTMRTSLVLAGAVIGLMIDDRLISMLVGSSCAMALSSVLLLAYMIAFESITFSQIRASILMPVAISSVTATAAFFIGQLVQNTGPAPLSFLAIITLIGAAFYVTFLRIAVPTDFRILKEMLGALKKRK